jgi:Kef-type K+ transport system membrane component KefB
MEPALAVGISITVIMLFALVFDRFRLPLILGVLLAGIIIGPYSPLANLDIFGFHFGNIIISDPSIVGVFAVLGSALILFGIGLEFSVVKLTQIGAFTFLAAAIKIGIVYLAGNAALLVLGFPAPTSALVAVALSFSSTPIIIKLLESSGKIRRPEVPFIISILIIEDLLAVFFLGLIAHPSASMNEYTFALSLTRVVLTFIFAYLVLSRIISRFLSLISHSDELLILGTVGLVLVIGYLAETIGLSFSVGAFLAGSTIAGSAESRKIEEKIRPFNSLFASFFFFSIGLLVNVGAVLSNLPLLFLFIAVGIAVRFFASGVSSYFAGFAGRNSCFCAAAFLPMSELSLLLMSQGLSGSIVSAEFLGSFAFAIIVSTFMSVWLVSRENEIYNLLLVSCPELLVKNLRFLRSTALGMRRAVSESSHYYRVVEKLPTIAHHTESLSTREQLLMTGKNSAITGLASLACYLGIYFAQEPILQFLNSFFIFIFIAFFSLSALFLVNLGSSFSSLVKMMARSSSGAKYLPVAHLCVTGFFALLCAVYFWAYPLAPSSLSVVLSVPALVFAAKSAAAAFNAFAAGRRL